MKVLGLVVLVFGSLAFASHAGTQQNGSDIRPGTELKQVPATLPGGEPIRLSALNIDRNWSTSITHLKGNVRVEIRETVRSSNRFIVVRADEATYNAITGELIPSGNVHITQEELE